jgi:hypothetical protein
MARRATVAITSTEQQSDRTIIRFKDGHTVVLEPYAPSRKAEGLRRFILQKDGSRVVVFNARLTPNGTDKDEFSFYKVADGYDVEKIVMYWEAARDHLSIHQYQGTIAGQQWRTISEDWLALHKIKSGEFRLP